jgi:hypothetical protein
MRTRRAPNFQRSLARTITLADGWQVKSLHDARELLLDVFGSVNARSGALDHAIRLLLRAAETGKRDDVAAAAPAYSQHLREKLLRGWHAVRAGQIAYA